jgi:hypothetical protein
MAKNYSNSIKNNSAIVTSVLTLPVVVLLLTGLLVVVLA